MFTQNKSELCKEAHVIFLYRQALILAKKVINIEIKTIKGKTPNIYGLFFHMTFPLSIR